MSRQKDERVCKGSAVWQLRTWGEGRFLRSPLKLASSEALAVKRVWDTILLISTDASPDVGIVVWDYFMHCYPIVP
ncbi:UNVERIFIED_CONTAM: hypothetical protein K2H54_066985 [Gekko kuhli]